MNKKLYVIISILALFASVKGQEFAPVGAEWHYNKYYRIDFDPIGHTFDDCRCIREAETTNWPGKENEKSWETNNQE